MSFPLPSVDLTSAVVGTKGTISLQNAGVSAGGISANPSLIDKPATLFMFNDSGCGLSIIFSQTGGGVNLPAGGWVPVPLPPGENKITWTVLYTLPSPPVSLLLLTYYPPEEDIPQSMTLGNSPVGIGGNVTTSSVQTLSNEGSASNLLVVDMGDTGHASIVTLYNDGHMLWSVDQSGTLHQIIKAQTSGTPLQIGQASDITEILGSLLVDKFLNITSGGDVTVNGSTSGSATLYQPLRGDYKLAMLFVSTNYNNPATVKTLALPTPFTNMAHVQAKGNCPPMRFLASGVAQTLTLVTGFSGVTGAETNVNVTAITAGAGVIGKIVAFDTIELSATGAVGNALIIIQGN